MTNYAKFLLKLKQSSFIIMLLCVVASLAIPQPAYAQISEFKITAGDAGSNDQFGQSVSISGDYAVVGARLDDDNGSSSGSAYVFKRSGTSWTQEAKLLPADGAASDQFGISVSISGDYAVVGAIFDDDNGTSSGSAYVFKRAGTSWAQEAKLLPSDGAELDFFGTSVSISGDYAVVGARFNDDNGSNSGSAYVFKRTGTSWIQEAKLLASDGRAFDSFGWSVSISGDYAVVSARFNDDNGHNSGSAYVFKRTGTSWTQEAKLLASDGAASDQFGISVSISGDYAVVGAIWDDDNGSNSGSAYVFKRTGTSWTQEAKLLASDGLTGDQFGSSVSISGGDALVGAILDDDNGLNSGSAYVFKRTGTSWIQEAKLLASDGRAVDLFGSSVSISGGDALVGAILDDDNGLNSGSAYIFTFSSPNALPIADSGLNQTVLVGANVQLDGSGSSDDDDDPLTYSWSIVSKPGGSTSTLTDATTVNPSFSPDLAGEYIVELIVNDGTADSDPDRVTITAQSAQEAAQDVIGQIETLLADALLNAGQGNSLIKKLENAIKKLDKEQEKVALNMLNAFINHVNSLIDEGVLGSADGDPLISAIQDIVDSLSAGLTKRTLVSNNANSDNYVLLSNYPNPFNPETRISFVLPEAGFTSIIIYDQLGREVARLVDGYLGAGNHSVTWNASNVASGMYFYRLQAGDFVQTRKMVLLK